MTPTEAPPAVGPLLPIISTIGWILVALVLAVPTMMSPMLFDSGGSTWTVIVVVGLMTSLFLCAVSVLAGWIVWGVTRRHRGGMARVFRGAVYLLPLVGIATSAIGFAGIQFVCGGSLDCAS